LVGLFVNEERKQNHLILITTVLKKYSCPTTINTTHKLVRVCIFDLSSK